MKFRSYITMLQEKGLIWVYLIWFWSYGYTWLLMRWVYSSWNAACSFNFLPTAMHKVLSFTHNNRRLGHIQRCYIRRGVQIPFFSNHGCVLMLILRHFFRLSWGCPRADVGLWPGRRFGSKRNFICPWLVQDFWRDPCKCCWQQTERSLYGCDKNRHWPVS